MGTDFIKKVKNNLALSFLVGTTLLASFIVKNNAAEAQTPTPPTFTRKISPKATFINADLGSVNSQPIDLQKLGIFPGDTIVLERFGYYSPFGDSKNEYYGSINATFSTSNILLPNNGSFNGATTERVPGAIDAVFANGCLPAHCIGKIFYISRGQDLVNGGFNGILVKVPFNTRYLFVGAADSQYGDNVDSNCDLAVGISKVLP
ncbi:MAG: hypothetical protein ACYTXC_11965 [Nostoc sp.]